MKPVLIILLCLTACRQPNNAQVAQQQSNRVIPGGCEDCELFFEGFPSRLSHIDTVIDFDERAPRIVVEGIVYQPDGKTPAKDVIIYMYHTDQTGRYNRLDTQTVGLLHGYIRGWAKTNDRGEYRFYTTRPAAYPNSQGPAHIHMLVKEPDTNPYYIDDVVFADDKAVDEKYASIVQNRGGDGFCTLTTEKDDLHHCKRDIVLGLNIQGYPKK